MFDGIKNLRALSLRNNSISRLGNYSFASIPDLAILDMSRNMLTNIPSTSLVKLHKLSLLDISNNSIETLEDGAFQNPISTIMLDGTFLNMFC
jgi:Leucine-rich repeat (LRR) protein